MGQGQEFGESREAEKSEGSQDDVWWLRAVGFPFRRPIGTRKINGWAERPGRGMSNVCRDCRTGKSC